MAYRYEMLTDDDQSVLMRDRLRRLEADHFKVSLEVRLAELIGDADTLNPVAQVELAGIEVKADALGNWLHLKEPEDA